MLSEEIKIKLHARIWRKNPNIDIDASIIKRISNPAVLGVYLFAKSYEENMCHPCTKDVIKYFFHLGQNKINNIFKELKEYGLISEVKIKRTDGRFAGSTISFN